MTLFGAFKRKTRAYSQILCFEPLCVCYTNLYGFPCKLKRWLLSYLFCDLAPYFSQSIFEANFNWFAASQFCGSPYSQMFYQNGGAQTYKLKAGRGSLAY